MPVLGLCRFYKKNTRKHRFFFFHTVFLLPSTATITISAAIAYGVYRRSFIFVSFFYRHLLFRLAQQTSDRFYYFKKWGGEVRLRDSRSNKPQIALPRIHANTNPTVGGMRLAFSVDRTHKHGWRRSIHTHTHTHLFNFPTSTKMIPSFNVYTVRALGSAQIGRRAHWETLT